MTEKQLKSAVLELGKRVQGLQAREKIRPLPKDGRDGAPGPKGDQGLQGDRGLQGPPGRDGRDGIQGPPGVNGVGVTRVALEAGNNLVMWLGDVKTSAGIIKTIHGKDGRNGKQGPQGPQGTQGPQGPIGPRGDSIEKFELVNNELFVVVEGVRQSVGKIRVPAAQFNPGGGGGAALSLAAENKARLPEFEVVVKRASQLENPESGVLYRIDGALDIGDMPILVPAGGLSIAGWGFDVSQLMSSATNGRIFTSPAGGSGSLNMSNFSLTANQPGARVFDLFDANGFSSIEMETVNFQDVTEIGTIDGYRQLFGQNLGFFGVLQGFTAAGVWAGGFRLATSVIRNSGANFYLLNQGTSLLFNSRVALEINVDFAAGATSGISDISPENLAQDSSFQVRGSVVTRVGAYDLSDAAYFPNISEASRKASFKDNVGLRNTRVGTTWQITTAVATSTTAGVRTKLLGTTTYTNEVHFGNLGSNAPVYQNQLPKQIEVSATLTYVGTQGDVITTELRVFRAATSTYETAFSVSNQLVSLPTSGGGATARISSVIELNENDRPEIWVINNTTGSVTAQVGSTFIANGF